MGLYSGKRVLIVGMLSKRSIAYGIAQSMAKEGAELAFTYQNDRVKDKVVGLAAEFNPSIVLPCDVTNDAEIDDVYNVIADKWKTMDSLIHAVAYAPADHLDGDYTDNLTRDGFKLAHDISSYSFAALAKGAEPLMKNGGSMVTLTYLGSMRVIKNYNVMGVAKASLEANMRYLASSLGPKGIRVNAISAGPIKTLAASGIKGFKEMLSHNAGIAPLRKNITLEDVGNTAMFLCSDMAAGITGEVVHVDAGYNIIGL